MNIPAPRIYARMAFYVGTALAAFLALAVGSVALLASAELASYVQTRQGPLGQEAAAVLAEGGRPALERWLAGTQVPAGATVFVLDAQSRDILGRTMPAYLEGFVRNSVVGPPDEPGSNYRPVRLAPQIIGPDGASYTFLVLPKGITIWGSPAITFGLILAALLVVGTVAWLVAGAFGRPVGELQTAVRQLASGRLEARLPAGITGRRDELGDLARDFNTMADQIVGLLEGRQQLMAELSHELRSPLARLQAAVALAAHRGGLGETERGRIEEELGRLDQVIGDVLRFSRLGSAAEIQRRLVRVGELLADLVRVEQIEATARGCELRLAISDNPTVVGDPGLLRSGLENILRNAIRYSPPGTSVEVSARSADGSALIDIADRGPGVPEPYLQRIFEPYFRAPGSGGVATGTGLGLAIARRVFEAHDGRVAAAARPGGGLVVSARLPLADFA